MEAKKLRGRPKKRTSTQPPTTQTIRNIDKDAMTMLRVYAVIHNVTLGEAVSVAARNLAGHLVNK